MILLPCNNFTSGVLHIHVSPRVMLVVWCSSCIHLLQYLPAQSQQKAPDKCAPVQYSKKPTARSSAETYVCSLNAHCFERNRRLGHFLKNNGLKSTDSDYSGHIVSNTWFHQLCLYLQFSDGPTTVQARVVHRSVHYTTYFGHCLYLAIDRGRWGVCGSLQSANREPHSADYTPVW